MTPLKKTKKKEMTNMCFMTIDELDEVNLNLNNDDLWYALVELYEDLKKFGLKMFLLERKIQTLEKEFEELQEKFLNVENAKTSFEKKNEILKNEY